MLNVWNNKSIKNSKRLSQTSQFVTMMVTVIVATVVTVVMPVIVTTKMLAAIVIHHGFGNMMAVVPVAVPVSFAIHLFQ